MMPCISRANKLFFVFLLTSPQKPYKVSSKRETCQNYFLKELNLHEDLRQQQQEEEEEGRKEEEEPREAFHDLLGIAAGKKSIGMFLLLQPSAFRFVEPFLPCISRHNALKSTFCCFLFPAGSGSYSRGGQKRKFLDQTWDMRPCIHLGTHVTRAITSFPSIPTKALELSSQPRVHP